MVLTDFVGVRITPRERQKLLAISQKTRKPGKISAALRWLVANAPDVEEKTPCNHDEVSQTRKSC